MSLFVIRCHCGDVLRFAAGGDPKEEYRQYRWQLRSHDYRRHRWGYAS